MHVADWILTINNSMYVGSWRGAIVTDIAAGAYDISVSNRATLVAV